MLVRDCATHELPILTLCEGMILGLNELPGKGYLSTSLFFRGLFEGSPGKPANATHPPRATWRKTSGGVPLETRHLCELTTSASGLVVYQPVFMCHGCIGVFRVSSMPTVGLYPSTVPLAPRLLQLHVRHRRWNALRGLLACCRLRGARRLKLPGSSWRCWPKLGPQISSSLAVSVSGAKASCCAFSKMSKYIALCFLQWFSEKVQFE